MSLDELSKILGSGCCDELRFSSRGSRPHEYFRSNNSKNHRQVVGRDTGRLSRASRDIRIDRSHTAALQNIERRLDMVLSQIQIGEFGIQVPASALQCSGVPRALTEVRS